MSLLEPPPDTAQKSRPLSFTVAALVLVTIVGLWWIFRFYPEKRAAEHFFAAVVAGDMAKAYQLWKPLPTYKMEDFLADWGPTGYYGPVKSYKIIREDSPRGSNAVQIAVAISQSGKTEEIVETLAIARRHGLWIIADEIYGRLIYDGRRAPSFHDVMNPDDKILFVQTLSKNWAMTGFRVGWLEAPAELGYVIENLVQYTTSGVPVFNQRAATAALEQGETFLAWQIERCRRSRDILCDGLAKTGRVRFFKPEAAFYLFCSVDGFSDSRALALTLIDEAGVGAAPGAAFGPGGEGHLRLCFARDPEQIAEATRRMARWLAA